MPQDSFVIGVDVGSGSARAGIFDLTGHMRARGTVPIKINRPAVDHAEHSSDDIWAAVCKAVRSALRDARVIGDDIRGLSFDATCSLVLLGADDKPATASTTGDPAWNVIMWADHRASAEAAEISRINHRVLDYVGGTMSPEMEMPKLLWLKRHLSQAWGSYHRAFDLADFLVWRATGQAVASECTVTCKWGYLAHEADGWQADFLALIGLDDLPQRASLVRRARPIGEFAGTLAPQSAAELGLAEHCRVGVGLIDAHAGGLGVLSSIEVADLDRHVAVISGTSTCHMATSRDPRSIRGVWGPYYGAMLPGRWLNEGGQSATGALLDHILATHPEGKMLGEAGHAAVLERIADLLAAEGPGLDDGLMVLPDFHGNRSPLADSRLRGVVHGLSLDSSLDRLARLYHAAALGIVLGTRHIIDAMNAAGYHIDTIHLTGGHARVPHLVRLYADATGCTVVLPREEDGVLLGTAMVAAVAAGAHPDIGAAGVAMSGRGQTFSPDRTTKSFYDKRYKAFLTMIEQRTALNALLA